VLRRRAKNTEEGDKYLLWGRRRNGLTDNFTLAVYMQFLVAPDIFPINRGRFNFSQFVAAQKHVK
jgi:hypothetical protein